MTKTEALRELEAMGTEQNRKLYQRHGVKGPVFGVSYANLGALQRRIRTDHALALALWSTGNHDARVLANMIADPNALSARELDRWIAEVDNHMLSESIASMLLRADDAHAHAQRWIDSPQEWICATGWQVFGGLASGDHEFSFDYLLKRLNQIQNTIQRAPNRVRHSMVLALIGIGSRGDKFEEAAVTAACMIGPVHVDHGETNCVTPDPIPYLRRIAAHRSARSQAAAAAAEPKKKPPTPRRARPVKATGGAEGDAEGAGSNAFTANKTSPRHESSSDSDARFAKKAGSTSRGSKAARAAVSKGARAGQANAGAGKSSRAASKSSGAGASKSGKAAGSAKAKTAKPAASVGKVKGASTGKAEKKTTGAPTARKAAKGKPGARASKTAKGNSDARRAAKPSSPSASKPAKKRVSGGGRSTARPAAASTRARKKSPTRTGSAKAGRRSASR